jgi:hypothetical protein
MVEQHAVHVAQQTQTQGKAAAQPLDSVGHGRHTSTDFAGIVERHAGLLVDFEQQQIGQRRLGAFDLRREHRLLAHEAVEHQVRVGQH